MFTASSSPKINIKHFLLTTGNSVLPLEKKEKGGKYEFGFLVIEKEDYKP